MNNVNAEIKIEKDPRCGKASILGKGKIKFVLQCLFLPKCSANLNRAESRIFVTFRPNEGVSNEISVTNGYPFKKE